MTSWWARGENNEVIAASRVQRLLSRPDLRLEIEILFFFFRDIIIVDSFIDIFGIICRFVHVINLGL